MVEIRDYTDSDYEDVKINLEEVGMFNPQLDTRENLRIKITKNPGSVIVAVVDNHAIGNAYIVYDGWNAFIFRLVTRKGYRMQGIGSLLMDEAESRMRKKGAKEVSLFIKEAELEHLERYYTKRGYVHRKGKYQAMYKIL